jgi:hypothetical protein
MEHKMILMDADFSVKAVLVARRKQASQAQQEAHLIRNQGDSVQVGGEAPDCENE